MYVDKDKLTKVSTSSTKREVCESLESKIGQP